MSTTTAAGCATSPAETFAEPDADIAHVPFAELIGDAVGRYSVRAILDAPAKFTAALAPLDADLRTLVLLDVLHDGLGRDGLHTFFFLSAAQHAPAIRDALATAGLKREHALFVEAMALFGPDYPIDNEARTKRFSYSSLDTPLNDFDKRMMEIARSFGGRETMSKAIVGYVERTPALWQRIEAQRAQLGEMDRLRNLNQALTRKIDIWDKPGAEVARRTGGPAPRAAHAVRHRRLQCGVRERRRAPVLLQFQRRDRSRGTRGAARVGARPAGGDLQARARHVRRQVPARYTTTAATSTSATPTGAPSTSACRILTDEFYALDGGPEVVRLGGNTAIEGGPGIWPAMAAYARAKQMLPC